MEKKYIYNIIIIILYFEILFYIFLYNIYLFFRFIDIYIG